MKARIAEPNHEEFNAAMKGVLAQFKEKLTAMEMLAVAAHFVGVLIAVQDQRTVTQAMAMELVAKNIEAGNREAVQSLLHSEGSA